MHDAGESLPSRIAAARSLPRAARLTAFAEALPHAGVEERESLALELLELAVAPTEPAGGPLRRLAARRARRETDRGLEAVFSLWGELPRPLRQVAIAVGEGRLLGTVSRLAESTSHCARLAACEVAGQSGRTALAPLAARLLGDGDERVREAADRALLSIGAAMVGVPSALLHPPFAADEPVGPADAGGADAAEHAIAAAAARYDSHRQRGVVLAALFVLVGRGEACGQIEALLEETADPAANALRGVLRWTRAPIARWLALVLLDRPRLATAALDRLGRADSPEEHALVLHSGHLLLRPGRAAAARGLEAPMQPSRAAEGPGALAPGGPIPDIHILSCLDAMARRGVPRMVEAMAADARTRAAALEPLLADGDVAARFAACRVAEGPLLADFCFDASAAVAQHAALRVVCADAGTWPAGVGIGGDPRARVLERLERSGHRRLRRSGPLDAGRFDPWRVRCASSRVLARRVLERQREEFLVALRRRLVEGQAAQRVDAISLARRLGVCGEIEATLLRLARQQRAEGDEERVVATAVSALADVPGAAASEAILEAMSSESGRTRANAIEASALRRGRGWERAASGPIVELKAEPCARARANAIRAELAGPEPAEAAEELASMLADDRAEHRLSGAWAAGRVDPRVLGPQREALGARLVEVASDREAGRARGHAGRAIARWLRSSGSPPSTDNMEAGCAKRVSREVV